MDPESIADAAARDADEQYYDDEYDEFDDEYEDELEDALMDCGLMHDGTCMKAGSEECDWECPFNS